MALPEEFALIRSLTENRQSMRFLQECGVVTGIGDDAAVAKWTNGRQLVMSCDAMVEGVHFAWTTMPDEDIGYKAMASNISDMAAMGAIPRFALVTLCIPGGFALDRLKRVYSGLYECASTYGVAVVGGDTVSAPAGLTMSVTVIGEVEEGKAHLRSDAEPGDIVFVTGGVGLSAAGLHYLLRQDKPAERWEAFAPEVQALITAHCRPLPQVAAGRVLAENAGGGALNDISDGLASEAWEIAEASELGLVLRRDRIPLDPDMQRYAAEVGADPWQWVFYGGEDYQLVGTVRAGEAERMAEAFRRKGLAFHPIGEVDAGFRGVRLQEKDGRMVALEKKGYNHFGGTD